MLNKVLAILIVASITYPVMSYETKSQETKKKEVVVKNNKNSSQDITTAGNKDKKVTKQNIDEMTLKQLHCFPYC